MSNILLKRKNKARQNLIRTQMEMLQREEAELRSLREKTTAPPTQGTIHSSQKANQSNDSNENSLQQQSATNHHHHRPQERFFGRTAIVTSTAVPATILKASSTTSPSSSISFSQSPQRTKQRRRRKWAYDSDSSDEIDIVQCALIADKKRQQQQQQQQQQLFAANGNSTVENDSKRRALLDTSVTSKRRALRFDSSSDSEQDFIRPPTQQNPSSPRKRARNPLTLMKEQESSTVTTPNTRQEASPNNLWSSDEEDNPIQSVVDSSTANGTKKTQRAGKRRVRDSNSNKSTSRPGGGWNDDDDNDDMDDPTSKKQKPDFDQPKFGPFECVPFELSETHKIPASINRYLPTYQREGIQFLYEKSIVNKKGAILGDDMGLGKTVQVACFLASILEKSGTWLDRIEIERRKKLAEVLKLDRQASFQRALLEGHAPASDVTCDGVSGDWLPKWAPVLIVMPPSVLEQWVKDLDTWGHFSIAIYRGQKTQKDIALEQIKGGCAEIVLCPKSLFSQKSDFKELCRIKWKLIVVDEVHEFKNVDGILSKHLRMVRDETNSVVIGLTGTLMQNNHKELWNLIDLVSKDFLGSWGVFENDFAKPLKFGRTKDATQEAKEHSDRKARELSDLLYRNIFIRRTKEKVLKDSLPTKDERIVFCEPSDLQKRTYQHILQLPDFLYMIKARGPCDCGVNQKFFLEYQHLRTKEERVAYQRDHKSSIVPRHKCCYRTPIKSDGSVDSRAVLWCQKHEETGYKYCDKCPFCIAFAALHMLYKLSNHVALLQIPESPTQCKPGSKEERAAKAKLEVSKVLIPGDVLPELPGGSYTRQGSVMDDHFNLSGKMRVLDKLLKRIERNQGRVLLFSASVQMLDLIENYIRTTGLAFRRMDGTTASSKREELAREFMENNDIFLFLLSTKAMGLGLNLTGANYVIIFDVEWNPSYDSQAQDRAYRIGQEKNVKVFRLVASGTIEELKYLRQVYKTQLTNETLMENAERKGTTARLFRGVEGDKDRKGELFGFANLFKFKDGTFMKYAREEGESRHYSVDVLPTESFLGTLRNISAEEEADMFGDSQHEMFPDLARKQEVDGDDTDLDEPLLGGESQVCMEILNTKNMPVAAQQAGAPYIFDGEMKSTSSSPYAGAINQNDERPPNHTKVDFQPHLMGPSSERLSSKDDKFRFHGIDTEPMVKGDTQNRGLEREVDQIATDHETPDIAIATSNGGRKRNIRLLGKTTNQIRTGAAGRTTFSAKDLALPKRSSKSG